MFRLFKSSLLIFAFSLSFVSFTHAQSIPGIGDPVTLRVSPEFPRPNTTVTVTAESFSTDLNRATFTWTSGGKTIKQGIGATSVSVPSGKAGIPTSVSASISTLDLGVFTPSISWRPADITLVWKSDGYTPPFYKGKALESYGSSFRVTAIPEFFSSTGNRIDSKTLIYTWKKNGTIDQSASGYGKDSFASFQTSYTRGGDDITVEVSNTDKSVSSVKTITLSPGTSDVVFYEESPLYGILYERALSENVEMNEEEITLRAEPFNISSNNVFANLSLDWTINGDSVPSFKNKNRITLRKSGDVAGETEVGLLIQHATKLLQGGQAAININQ